MLREICLVCPHIVCVNEGRENDGRRIFFAHKGSEIVKTPIQNCDKYLAIAVLGTLQGNALIYRERNKCE